MAIESRLVPGTLKARIRSAVRKKRKEPPPVNQFGRGAEQAFQQADVALTKMSEVGALLKQAANQQMLYSRAMSRRIKNLALDELGYAREEREMAQRRMDEADAMYEQYDDEYRARQQEYNRLWKPVEERTAELAMDAGRFDESVLGTAASDAAQAAARSDEDLRHQMAQMGINPESGRYGDYMRRKKSDDALMSAYMINQARARERDRARTTGLASAQSALGLGTDIYRGDQAGRQYMINRSNVLSGLSEAARNRGTTGMARGANMLGQSAAVRQSGMEGLRGAANVYGNVAGTSRGLAATYAPLSIEQAKMASTPSLEQAAETRMDIMDAANARTQKTKKSYPWTFVFGGR